MILAIFKYKKGAHLWLGYAPTIMHIKQVFPHGKMC